MEKTKEKQSNKKSFFNKFNNKIRLDKKFFGDEDLEDENNHRNKISIKFLFTILIGFFILINILVFLDVNLFNLRSVLSFVFFIIVPGYLILLSFKVRNIKFLKFMCYSVGLSVSYIISFGFLANLLYPLLNITSRPLETKYILPLFDLIIVLLFIVAYYRNKREGELKFNIPKLNGLNSLLFAIPLMFPFLSILGSFILNNHGPNILTMIMIGIISMYLITLSIFKNKLNPKIYPWALWLIGLGLLLSNWTRGWFIGGTDISLEYWIFQTTKEIGKWNIVNYYNSYDVMLSLTILPTILSNLISINDQFIFKLIFPLIFSTLPLVIYLISTRFLNKYLSFLSGLLFVFMPDFLNGIGIPIRQMIGFVFFSLMILLIIEKRIENKSRKIFFLIFGVSMIVSHYSTAYISLAIILFAYFLTAYFKFNQKKIKKDKKNNSNSTEQRNFFLTAILVLLLILFAFLWYNQVTSTGDNLIDFSKNSFNKLKDMFNEDFRQVGPEDPIFGIFNKPMPISEYINKYKNKSAKYDLSNTSEGFSSQSYSSYSLRYIQPELLPAKFNIPGLFKINYYSKQIISKLFQLFILFGLIYFILQFKGDDNLRIISISFMITIIMLLILPAFSYNYGLTRSILQVMIILSPISILGGILFFKTLKINGDRGLMILLVLFLLLFSGFVSQIIGGDVAKEQLNNFGINYDVNYMVNQDFRGAEWINRNRIGKNLHSDSNALLKLNVYGGYFNHYNVNSFLLPSTISKKGYVYVSTINNLQSKGFFSIMNTKVSYNYPGKFISDNKNQIYSNGGSKIFR